MQTVHQIAQGLEHILESFGSPPPGNIREPFFVAKSMIVMELGYTFLDALEGAIWDAGSGPRGCVEVQDVVSRTKLATQLAKQLEHAPWAELDEEALHDPNLTVFGPVFISATLLALLGHAAMQAINYSKDSPLPAIILNQVNATECS